MKAHKKLWQAAIACCITLAGSACGTFNDACGTFCGSLEFVYFKYCKSHNLGDPVTESVEKFLEHDFEPGGRIRLGWNPSCMPNVEFSYTYFESDASQLTTNAFDSGSSVFIPSNSRQVRETVKWHQSDLLFDLYRIENSYCGDLHFLAGFRYLKIDRNLDYQPGSSFAPPLSIDDRFSGGGLAFRLDMQKPILCAWYLDTSIGGSILCGNNDATLLLDSLYTLNIDKHNIAAGSIEGAFYLSRTFCLCQLPLTFRIGAEAAHWMGVGSYTFPFTPTPFPHESTDRRITLVGYNIGLGVCF